MSTETIRRIETDETPESIERGAGSGYGFKGTKQSYVGNGENILHVPFLDEIYGLVVGDTVMQLVENRTVPLDASHKNFEDLRCPMCTLSGKGEDTYLTRSAFSNDGIWQKDVPIHIWGAWKDAKSLKSSEKKDGGAK